MKKSIGEVFSNQFPKGDTKKSNKFLTGDYAGIEIEVEGYPSRSLKNWRASSDGSLRDNGVEFVMKKPMSGNCLELAIEEIDSTFRKIKPRVSWRTSTHFHIDVTDLSYEEYMRYALILYTFEPVFFDINSEDRTNSNFCLPLKKNQGLLDDLRNLNKGLPENFPSLLRNTTDWPKYTSINLRPASTLGTIEVRCHECMIRKEDLYLTVNRLFLLKKFARDFTGTNKKLLKVLKGLEYERFLSNTVPTNFKINSKGVKENIRILQDVINIKQESSPSRSTVRFPEIPMTTSSEEVSLDSGISYNLENNPFYQPSQSEARVVTTFNNERSARLAGILRNIEQLEGVL